MDAELVGVSSRLSGIFLFSFFSSNSHAICKFHDVSSGDFCLNIHLQDQLFCMAWWGALRRGNITRRG